jgi:hypothetical protein
MFDDGRAAIHPVAAVEVADAVAIADRGPVDVAADHPVQPALAHGVQHRILEVEDEADRGLHLALGVAGQGPVAGGPQSAADPGEPAVDPYQQVVGNVAEHRHPAVVAGHLVEFVAMHQQVAAAVGGGVDVFVDHLDVAEGGAVVLPQGLVVVAGDEEDLAVVAGAAQHLLHHRVLGRGPDDASAHGPEIDDVADQEEVVRRVLAQEVEQPFRLAGAGAQVDVGEEDGSDRRHGVGRQTTAVV